MVAAIMFGHRFLYKHRPSLFFICDEQGLVAVGKKRKIGIDVYRYTHVFGIYCDEIVSIFRLIRLYNSTYKPRMMAQTLENNEEISNRVANIFNIER